MLNEWKTKEFRDGVGYKWHKQKEHVLQNTCGHKTTTHIYIYTHVYIRVHKYILHLVLQYVKGVDNSEMPCHRTGYHRHKRKVVLRDDRQPGVWMVTWRKIQHHVLYSCGGSFDGWNDGWYGEIWFVRWIRVNMKQRWSWQNRRKLGCTTVKRD